MAFRPLHDRVLVRRVEAEEKTAGGIIIPDTAKEKPQKGEVIAVVGLDVEERRLAGLAAGFDSGPRYIEFDVLACGEKQTSSAY